MPERSVAQMRHPSPSPHRRDYSPCCPLRARLDWRDIRNTPESPDPMSHPNPRRRSAIPAAFALGVAVGVDAGDASGLAAAR
jgi:hypothetical protein